MARMNGRFNVNLRQEGETVVSLRRPKVVERGSHQMAELAIMCESVEVMALLTREELENLVRMGQELLDERRPK